MSRNGRAVKYAVLRHGSDLDVTNACGYVWQLQVSGSKWLGCHVVYMLIQCTPLLVEKARVTPDVTFGITIRKQERVQARDPLRIWNPWGRRICRIQLIRYNITRERYITKISGSKVSPGGSYDLGASEGAREWDSEGVRRSKWVCKRGNEGASKMTTTSCFNQNYTFSSISWSIPNRFACSLHKKRINFSRRSEWMATTLCLDESNTCLGWFLTD